MTKKTYLDYAATTPVDRRVLDIMLPLFTQDYGNPSSIHQFGQRAEAALENSREIIALGLNCHPEEVIFTACGSESNNIALRGVALAAQRLRDANHILISPIEHPAISKTAKQLGEYFGFEIEYLPVDSNGLVDPEDVRKSIRSSTAIVSVIYANNEVGTINSIEKIGEVCQERGISFHTDGVQAAAFLPTNVKELNVNLLSLGAHKFYGPKGVGVLYIRKGTPIIPTLTGGGQEYGIRAGTHNIPSIVGMAEAFRLAQFERNIRLFHVQTLRDKIIACIQETIPDSRLTGHPSQRLPNHTSFVFRGINGNTLIMMLDIEGFACSSGSACKTGDPEPSDILTALGFSRDWAFGSLRVTLGTPTCMQDIENFLYVLPRVITNARTH
jgi:cysteine desulfurase